MAYFKRTSERKLSANGIYRYLSGLQYRYK
jgi:hypothetical protein